MRLACCEGEGVRGGTRRARGKEVAVGKTVMYDAGDKVRARKYQVDIHQALNLEDRVGTVVEDHRVLREPVKVYWQGLNQVHEHPASGLRYA